jgi:hypothetical protein
MLQNTLALRNVLSKRRTVPSGSPGSSQLKSPVTTVGENDPQSDASGIVVHSTDAEAVCGQPGQHGHPVPQLQQATTACFFVPIN